MRRHIERLAAVVLLLALPACNRNKGGSEGGPSIQRPRNAIEIVFPYGSEKEKWISDVTDQFNREEHKIADGRPIFVTAKPMGSGETMDEVLAGRIKAHLVSPASAAFIRLANAESKAKTGRDLIGGTENLVLSPVVIAMWKPMAEAIGWGKKPVGWADVLAIARNPKGWADYGFPQWGRFKFGHTHPQYSNSGLISMFAEVYAATGKTRGLTLADVDNKHTGDYVAAIQQSVVHYGNSTGFFGRRMFANGPSYLSAAVLYESMVVESYSKPDMQFPVVAIYPKEGTFWSDHPVGIVDRDWVTPAHREAATAYIHYLLDKPQQQKALTYGFRPASLEVPLSAPIDAAHGVDPAEPRTTLEVPSVDVINRILGLWEERRKKAGVVLVLDTSGSMSDEGKLVNAKVGAKQLISLMGDRDTFSLLPFNTEYQWALQDAPLSSARAQAQTQIDSLFAGGSTALYDSIEAGWQHLKNRSDKGDEIQAVVVLTDGSDTDSKETLDRLLNMVRFNGETNAIRIFTIAYGSDARTDVLKQIAEATQAQSYQGTPENIVAVFRDVSTFF